MSECYSHGETRCAFTVYYDLEIILGRLMYFAFGDERRVPWVIFFVSFTNPRSFTVHPDPLSSLPIIALRLEPHTLLFTLDGSTAFQNGISKPNIILSLYGVDHGNAREKNAVSTWAEMFFILDS